jgi:hypothetical protein
MVISGELQGKYFGKGIRAFGSKWKRCPLSESCLGPKNYRYSVVPLPGGHTYDWGKPDKRWTLEYRHFQRQRSSRAISKHEVSLTFELEINIAVPINFIAKLHDARQEKKMNPTLWPEKLLRTNYPQPNSGRALITVIFDYNETRHTCDPLSI